MARDGTTLPTTIFLCVHKGASTFVNDTLGRAAEAALAGLRRVPYGERLKRGQTFEDLALPPRGVLATRVYPHLFEGLVEAPVPAAGRFADKKLVVMRRDPRDAAVSLHYAYTVNHPVPPAGFADRFLACRERLVDLDVRQGVEEATADIAITEFRAASAVLEQCPWAIDLPYELLVTDCRSWFARLVDYLGWPPTLVDDLGPTLAEEVAPPAREDPTVHKRRVRPGNWLDVFDDALNERFFADAEREMLAAGYEPGSVGV